MRFKRAHEDRIRAFDLTPMIDVVLQLIIFFMFTSQFGELARTEVDLPRESGQEDQAPKPALAIDLTREGVILLEREPITLEGLAQIAAMEIERAGDADKVMVRVRPDRACRAAHLNRVMNRLASVGVRKWSIGTMDPELVGGAP